MFNPLKLLPPDLLEKVIVHGERAIQRCTVRAIPFAVMYRRDLMVCYEVLRRVNDDSATAHRIMRDALCLNVHPYELAPNA